MSKRRIESAIATLFGGRIAEELIFGRDAVTTGASNDIERATDLARNMVTKWGLSDRLGPLTYSEESGEVFLGRQVTQTKQVSDVTAHAIDEEVRRVIETNYNRAKSILETHLDKLHAMADALIKYETIDDKQIREIMDGKPPTPPEGWDSGPGGPTAGGQWRQRARPASARRRSARQPAIPADRPVAAVRLICADRVLDLSRPGGHGRAQCHARFLLRWRPLRELCSAR